MYLKKHNVIGIEGIDTRKLTQLIREHGTLKGVIHLRNNIDSLEEMTSEFAFNNLAYQVCRNNLLIIGDENENNQRIMVVDCGIKNNQLRMLMSSGKVTLYVIGINAPNFEYIFEAKKCSKLFISNGPGDPRSSQFFFKKKKSNNRRLENV
jgi:carbamoyl-phosphate synthase small subunit